MLPIVVTLVLIIYNLGIPSVGWCIAEEKDENSQYYCKEEIIESATEIYQVQRALQDAQDLWRWFSGRSNEPQAIEPVIEAVEEIPLTPTQTPITTPTPVSTSIPISTPMPTPTPTPTPIPNVILDIIESLTPEPTPTSTVIPIEPTPTSVLPTATSVASTTTEEFQDTEPTPTNTPRATRTPRPQATATPRPRQNNTPRERSTATPYPTVRPSTHGPCVNLPNDDQGWFADNPDADPSEAHWHTHTGGFGGCHRHPPGWH